MLMRLRFRPRFDFAAALLAMLGVLALLPSAARADPADISAAARGVVRVVIIGTDGQEIYPISHGSGFAVSSNRIVTNAHVIQEALQDDTLQIGVVPSDGDGAAYTRVVTVSPRIDLALLEITGSLRLPPLTLAGDLPRDSGEVSAVGYPMNVDRAQGLAIGDIFKPQPPVKSRGFVSGTRPSRQFDTVLHTAPIARGNSGGPLLDNCGRVVGANSFGADSEGGDAEFFFAVSNREILPFLRENGVQPRVNSMPCRSLADIDAAERARLDSEQSAARREMAARSLQSRERRARVQLEVEQEVQEERENAMALAGILLLIAFGAGLYAWQAWNRGEDEWDDEAEDEPYEGDGFIASHSAVPIAAKIAAIVAVAALLGALALWFTRPGLDAIDRRVAAAMQEDGDNGGAPLGNPDTVATEGNLVCTLEPGRSRIVGTPDEQVEFSWNADGCVNGRTQYGMSGGTWSRVFVPNEEDAVSVNRYDPESRTFRTDRYLLTRSGMNAAREARGKYSVPQCDADQAAANLGDLQSGVTALLPDRPNERWVYSCQPSGNAER